MLKTLSPFVTISKQLQKQIEKKNAPFMHNISEWLQLQNQQSYYKFCSKLGDSHAVPGTFAL